MGAVIVKTRLLDVRAALATVTDAAPAVVSSDAGTVACRTVELWNVVARFVGFPPRGVHTTTELLVKPAPVTCMVRGPDPAEAEEGDNEASEGPITSV